MKTKGQISLEYLVLSVVLLVVLSISVATLMKVKENSDDAYKLVMLNNDLTSVYNAAEDVCAMGDGNSRAVGLNRKLYLYGSAKMMAASYGDGKKIMKNTTCETEIDGWFDKTITVENKDGVILIQ